MKSIEDSTPEVPALPPKRRYRRFNLRDVEDIAVLAAKRLTDTMACEILGINYDSFRVWKCKNKNDTLLTSAFNRARANQLKSHIENIEDAAIGAGVHSKRPDWRASDALIKLKFPELAPQILTIPSPTLNLSTMTDALKKAYIDVEEVKLIADKPTIKVPTRKT